MLDSFSALPYILKALLPNIPNRTAFTVPEMRKGGDPMYVGRIMHTELVTVSPETPVAEAREILDAKRIWHLLVVDKKGELAGLLSDRDVKKFWASPATTLSKNELSYLLSRLTVDAVMTRKPDTVTPDTTIERAALIMQQNRIGALPVVEGDKLVGIITRSDVLRVLLEAIGIDRGDSTRFTVLIERDRVGFIAEMANILKERNINIRSLVSWPDSTHKGVFHLTVRVRAEDGETAITALKKAGFTVLTEYIEDITPFLKKD